MSKKDVNITIGGDASGLNAAMAEARAVVTGAVGNIQDRFTSLQAIIGRVQTVMLGLTAVMAGGAAFKEAVAKTVELHKSSKTMGRQLGISASQASVLKVALGEVYVTEEQFNTAAAKVTQTLNKNEAALTGLGVATRDSNGNFRSTTDIIQDVNTKLLEFKAGTDRNVEGVKIYGRSWKEVEPTLRLTTEVMEATRAKAESLGLVVGEESAAQTDRYRAAMNDVGDVVDGLSNAVGQVLLPFLSEMGEWFASIGPEAVQATKVVMVGLVTVVQSAKLTIEIAFELIRNAVAQTAVWFRTLGDVAGKALRLDFDGARAAWTSGMDQLKLINQKTAEAIRKDWDETQEAVSGAMSRAFNPDKPLSAPPSGGDATSTGGAGGANTSRIGQWNTELEERKAALAATAAAEGSFREFSKSEELAYWQEIRATRNLNAKEDADVRRRIAALQTTLAKDSFTAEIATLKEKQLAYQNDAQSRLEIQRQVAERLRLAYGEESSEYQQARREILTTERQVADQLLQIAEVEADLRRKVALAGIDEEEEAARQRVALGLQTEGQLIEQEAEFENRRFQLKQQALLEKLKLAEQDPDRNPPELARLHAQIEELELEHQAKLNKIKTKAAEESQKHILGTFRSIERGWGNSIASMVRGQTTFSDGVRSMAVSVLAAMEQMIADIAAQWLIAQVAQLLGIKTTAASSISARAAEAGAAGTASWAGAPWPINMGAPAFGAAMAATAMAYLPAVAAEKGYDVPSGLSPVTKLHPREMVLPAELADSVRSMARVKSSAAGGGTVIVQGVDAKSIERWAKNPSNAKALFDGAARHAARKFRKPK